MVQAAQVAPAASAASAAASGPSTRASGRRRPPPRLRSSGGSFHAGAPIPSYDDPSSAPSSSRGQASFLAPTTRRLSMHKYNTFPTQLPKAPRHAYDAACRSAAGGDDASLATGSDTGADDEEPTPLPWKQLGLLALLSLAEQTALNSISPYLPTMVAGFPEIPDGEAGLYVGLLASAFALAQLATNLLWGYMSDVVGRKPIMLLGTSLLAVCFAFFGFCGAYWQVVVVHVAMGLLNGNAAVVPTVLGEVTDRSNQSRAFTWLPVLYSIGGITGPALGGLLAQRGNAAFPFLAPNLCGAALLAASVVVLGIWFDETLDDAERRAVSWSTAWIGRLCCCRRGRERGRLGSWSSRWPTSMQDRQSEDVNASSDDDSDGEDVSDETASLVLGQGLADGAADPKSSTAASAASQILTRNTVIVLATYLVFQLSNISFNSLYPIFASAALPTGRALPPGTIGVLLSLAGAATIVFQVFIFQPLRSRMGNLGTYRWTLLGLAISMALMPWVGYQDDSPFWGLGTGEWWLYVEVAIVLVFKNICAVGGLSSVMLLITNCAPSHETLGTLNGIAQTLSAAGRSLGPFVSGGLFTLSMRVEPKGELLAWGVFGGISLAGWLGTLAIRGKGLESGDWVGSQSGDDEQRDSADDEEAQDPESRESAR